MNTGNPLPEGCDAVIMIEHTSLEDGNVRIEAPAYPWQHVRRIGEDIVATELLFPRNRLLRPWDVAALLSGGSDAAALDRLGQGVPAGRFLHLASTLQKASAELYASANRRLDAELCLLRLCDESLSGDLTALEARIARLEDNQAARAALAQRPGAAPPEQAPPPHKEPPAPPKFPDPPPWDEPPLPEEPPMTDGPGQRVYDIPEAPPLPPAAHISGRFRPPYRTGTGSSAHLNPTRTPHNNPDYPNPAMPGTPGHSR